MEKGELGFLIAVGIIILVLLIIRIKYPQRCPRCGGTKLEDWAFGTRCQACGVAWEGKEIVYDPKKDKTGR